MKEQKQKSEEIKHKNIYMEINDCGIQDIVKLMRMKSREIADEGVGIL